MVLVGVGFAAKEGRTTAGRVGLVALHVLGRISVAAVVGDGDVVVCVSCRFFSFSFSLTEVICSIN